ncbi:MAG TPA: hypothetical protein VGW38_29660, partial [Chloroflexota bacterium]|nr:hypothetical protein [Chloroflexota bacterium]
MSDQPTSPANPTKQALQDLCNRRRSEEASLVAAYQRALSARLALDSTASDPQQKAADQKVKNAREALEAHQKGQRSLEEKIATTTDTPKADSAASVTVATNTTEPYIVQRRPNGSLETLPNPNYQGKAPSPRRTQVVAGNLINLDTGDVLAKVPKDARTQVVGNNLVDLDTGRVLASLPEAPGVA